MPTVSHVNDIEQRAWDHFSFPVTFSGFNLVIIWNIGPQNKTSLDIVLRGTILFKNGVLISHRPEETDNIIIFWQSKTFDSHIWFWILLGENGYMWVYLFVSFLCNLVFRLLSGLIKIHMKSGLTVTSSVKMGSFSSHRWCCLLSMSWFPHSSL